MAHEVENMMYVGATPWHKLGTRVLEAPLIEDAIRLAGLDWQVILKPLYVNSGGNGILEQRWDKAPAMATVRETDGSVLGVVGTDYSVLQNSEAFSFFQPFVDSGQASLETAGSLRGGQRVWVLARVNMPSAEVVTGDQVGAFILLSNSHDGTQAARCGFAAIRVVCANTLAGALRDSRSSMIRVRHVGKVAQTLEALRETMDVVRGEFTASVEAYRALAAKPINTDDLHKYVRQVFAPKKKAAPRQVDGAALLEEMLADVSAPTESAEQAQCRHLCNEIERLAAQGRGVDIEGVMGTAWGAYNAVTEYLQHERGKSEDTRLDRMWFGGSAALNRRALDVALDMIS